MNDKKRVDEETVIKKRKILKINLEKNFIEHLEDEVVVEQTLQLYVNNKFYATFAFSPSQIKELIIGRLLTQATISKPEAIRHINIKKRKAEVKLQYISDSNSRFKEKVETLKTSDVLVLNLETVLKLVKILDNEAVVFKRTGGTHAAALFDSGGKILAFSEDIGRHNAVDKVVGEATLKGIDLKKTVLASTGRLSSEIVMKAANVNIPVIVSLASPTDKGISVAERKGITIIGFARGRGFNLYTHPERIKKQSIKLR
jgi:FdhD protein